MDPRHHKRLKTVQNLFALSFEGDKNFVEVPFKDETFSKDILAHKEEINACIQKYAPKYPVEKIAKIDISILQLAIYELLFVKKKQPTKVIINEAVELAKEMGNERSYAFVNAVLGSVVNDITSKEPSDGNKSE
ncbi:transcription antitermination factor NusB [Candidatus Roizmanbacteria bacterium]|nr:MAG: transcription antitermination factor NusB [Candidatus Roizmanbacteria bacterium]